jgi:SAM-dependent methyltransferase
VGGRLRPALRGAGLAGARALLRGDRHECPCCGGRFARFIMRDDSSRVCPRCRSRERQRVLWLYLQRELGIETSTARVLHLAPEAALYDRLRALPELRYETGDLAPGPLVDRTMDVERLPHADDSLDLVLCSHVLEHVADDIAAARELARVLVPGGLALVQVPVEPTLERTYEDAAITTPEGRLQAFGQADHLRIYAADVADRLRAGGLAAELVRYADAVPAELRFRHLLADRGVRPGSDIYRCAA